MPHNLLPHIIHRQILEVHLPYGQMNSGIEEQVKYLFYAATPKIEKVFSTFDDPRQLTRIDHLFVDLGTFDHQQLDELFVSRLCEALSSKLSRTVATAENFNSRHYTDISMPSGDRPETRQSHAPSSDGIENDSTEIGKRYPTEEGIVHAFFYYLENGIYPWWLSMEIEEDVEDVFSMVLHDPSSQMIRQLKVVLATNQTALKRLNCQFSPSFIYRVIFLLQQNTSEEMRSLFEAIQHHWLSLYNTADRNDKDFGKNTRLLFAMLLASDPIEVIKAWVPHLSVSIQKGNITFPEVQQLLSLTAFIPYREIIEREVSGIVPDKQSPDQPAVQQLKPPIDFKEKNIAVHDKKEKDENESIDKFLYVDHAGLVILHPFLSQFFSGLKLLNEQKQFIDEEAQAKAVYLLSFLACGKIYPSEATLPFCKFLSGLQIKTAIVKNIELNENEKQESEQLLKAVISHWQVLGKTSADGLREGFINRKGKLDFRDEGTTLFVETKPHDVLLERLPWTISIVHLPWIDKPFNTMWN